MLTARQEEFLKAVARLSEEGGGVHYTRVAQELGVSKWTAYDLLTSLARKGWLLGEHELKGKRGRGGRSRINFRLSPRAISLLAPKEGKPGTGEAEEIWKGVKQFLWAKIEECKEKSAREVMAGLAAELQKVGHPLIFSAYLLVMILLTLRFLVTPSGNSVILDFLLSLLTNSQAALIAFGGAALTLFLQLGFELPKKEWGLGTYLAHYEKKIREIKPVEERLLLGFVREVVKELWPGLEDQKASLA